MKYTVKEKVWQDKITGQQYTRDYAFKPVVTFNEKGEVIRGYSYSPYGLGSGIERIRNSHKEFGYSAHDLGQKLFLTDEQVAERFEYLGELTREEDIDAEIKYYSEEECNFNNLEWLAKLTIRDLTHRDNGGLSQCVHAKLLEFLFQHAPASEKMEEIKKIYFNNDEVEQK